MAYNFGTGASGAMGGAATGAMIGSVVPVIGTGIGAIAGGVMGAAGGLGGGEEESPPTPWEIYKKMMRKSYPAMAAQADSGAATATRQNIEALQAGGMNNSGVFTAARTSAQRQAGAEKRGMRNDLYKQAMGLAAAQPPPQPQQQGGGMGGDMMGQLGQMAGMGAFGGASPFANLLGPKQPQTPPAAPPTARQNVGTVMGLPDQEYDPYARAALWGK